ncbi:CD4-1 molecule [Polymixia lowei]
MKGFIRSLIIVQVILNTTTAVSAVVVYGQVGDRITLPVSSLQTDLYVRWYFGTPSEGLKLLSRNSYGHPTGTSDAKWKDRVSLTGYSLIINKIQQDEFKIFTCVLETSFSPISTTTYQLYTVHVTPSASSLLAGASLSLSCEVQKSTKQTQIHWRNPQNQKVANGNKLSVMNVTIQHNGMWACVVKDDGPETRVETSVTIVDLSQAPSSPRYTSLSNRLDVPCSVPPHLSWKVLKEKGIRGGHWSFTPGVASGIPEKLFSLSVDDPPAWRVQRERALSASDPSKNDLSLRRKLAKEEDRGWYTCALEFTDGVTLERRVRVEVLKVVVSPNVVVTRGQQVNLTCSLGHPLTPELEVKWTSPKLSSLSLPATPHPARLTVLEAGYGDEGTWKCELRRNQTLLTSAAVTLKIESAPMSVWLLLTICGVVVIVLLLLIVTAILIRQRRQRTMKPRHPKHRFCRCKNPKPKGFYRT